jgi:hypothetical protein
MKDVLVVAIVAAVAVLGWTHYEDPVLLTKIGGFLADTFSDSKTTAAVLSAIFAAATLGVQFWVGGRQATIGSRHQNSAMQQSAGSRMPRPVTARSVGRPGPPRL